MRPSRIIGNVPRVGVEIEISRWAEQESGMMKPGWDKVRNQKTKLLVDAGLMSATPTQQPYHEKFHNWNCTCWTCKMWEQHDTDPYPIQFTLKYDGTLPLTGGEYISSPFSINMENWASFAQGWNLLTATAVADREIQNKQGNLASPSVHVHASCQNDDYDMKVASQFRWEFAPEIIVLAGASKIPPRAMKYRQMTPDTEYHHSYMNVQSMRKVDKNGKYVVGPNGNYLWSGPHIELRTWEPEYDLDQYIEGAVHTTAALSQIMSSATVAKKMIGLMYMRQRRSLPENGGDTGVPFIEWQKVVDLVDMDIYRMLQHAMLSVTYASNNPDAASAINWMFDEAAERWLK